jgi:hypothetical protein
MDTAGYKSVVAARADQPFPIPQATSVPVRLQPLAMDLAVMLTQSAQRGCSKFRITATQSDPGTRSEHWSIDGCGTIYTVNVELRPCNNMLGNPIVAVSRVPFDGHSLEGKDPLDASFLVACPNKK